MMNGQIAENVGPLANRYVLVLELRPSREDDDESIASTAALSASLEDEDNKSMSIATLSTDLEAGRMAESPSTSYFTKVLSQIIPRENNKNTSSPSRVKRPYSLSTDQVTFHVDDHIHRSGTTIQTMFSKDGLGNYSTVDNDANEDHGMELTSNGESPQSSSFFSPMDRAHPSSSTPSPLARSSSCSSSSHHMSEDDRQKALDLKIRTMMVNENDLKTLGPSSPMAVSQSTESSSPRKKLSDML